MIRGFFDVSRTIAIRSISEASLVSRPGLRFGSTLGS